MDSIMPQKKCIVLFLLVLKVLLFFSCSDPDDDAAINSRENAVLTVSDIRVKGFTLSWPEFDKDCEYAVAASHNNKIENYQTALENGCIILDFTPADILEGTYRVKGVIPGKEYEIKLFVRKPGAKAEEYLKSKAVLPYIDDAELVNVYLDGEQMLYDKTEDSFTHFYIPGKKDSSNFKITYKTARLCNLYMNGKKIENGEFTIQAGESVSVVAVNEKTGAARDYEIAVKTIDNGIPVLIIETEGTRSVSSRNKYIDAQMLLLDNNSDSYGKGLYSGQITIKGRGNSSFGMPKRSYNINTPGKIKLLDMAESKDWILTANFSDKSLMRNYIAFELYRDMGAAFSPKFRFVDLILNGEYSGTYCLGERIKIDPGRLDIPKIKAGKTSGGDLSGGYVLEVNSTDKYDRDEIIFETKRINWGTAHFFSIKQPGEKNISEEAYNYISQYVNDTEDALFGKNFDDPKEGYRKYIDVPTFIDWYIVNEVFKNVDAGFHTSVYMYKTRGGKLCMGPVWDFDLGAGNADYSGCDDPAGWYVRYSAWFGRLFEDISFTAEFCERWNYVKENYFKKTFERITETAELLKNSQSMNFAKWPILGVYVWPNAGNVSERNTYEKEIEYLKEWLLARIEWMDGEINKNN